MGRKGKLRAALRATAGALVWALAVLLLNGWLGWPSSWPTLVATGGLAFLASAAASWALRGPWAARAGAVCTLALLLSCPLVGWPFGVPETGKEMVWRKVEFQAYLLGTEDNGPIENVIVGCRLPTTPDNWFDYPRVAGYLYYLDENDNLRLEVCFKYRARGWTVEEVWEGTHPERMKPPEILGSEVSPSIRMFVMDFDKIYPREAVIIEMYIEVPKEKVALLSLREPGENSSRGVMCDSLGRKVRQSFVLRFWEPRKDRYVLLEEYRRNVEYNGSALIRLYPVPLQS